MSRIAIDFGTSRIKIAYWDARKEKVKLVRLNRDTGYQWVPSLVWMGSDGVDLESGNGLKWGLSAEKELGRRPEGIVADGMLKRLLGKRFFTGMGSSAPVVEVVAGLFKGICGRLVRDVSYLHKDPPRELVIPVPALWIRDNYAMAGILKEGAERSGVFEEVNLISEPVAAARWWGRASDHETRSLVVLDCGGGTADWSALKLEDGRFVEHSPGGSVEHAGGADVDSELASSFYRALMSSAASSEAQRLIQGAEVVRYRQQIQRLKEEYCEEGYLGSLSLGEHRVEIEESEIQAVLQEVFLNKLRPPLSSFLDHVRESTQGPVPVLFVGGSSGIPGLPELVSSLGGEALRWEDALFATVQGAALPEVDGEAARSVMEAEARKEAERKAKEEAERKAKEEAERKAKVEAERRRQEEIERQVRVDAERSAREQERRTRGEAERRAKEEAERRAKEELRAKGKSNLKNNEGMERSKLGQERREAGFRASEERRTGEKKKGEQESNHQRVGFQGEVRSVQDVETSIWKKKKWVFGALFVVLISVPLFLLLAKRTQSDREEAVGASREINDGFVLVKAGKYTMTGGNPSNSDYLKDHEVTISRDFWIQEFEVTQEEWEALMGNNYSHNESCGEKCPIERVSFYAAIAYTNALSRSEGLEECYVLDGCDEFPPGEGMECTGVKFLGLGCEGYRLPTEAEWEYAARAGSTEPILENIDGYMWNKENSNDTTHPAGQRKANSNGIYDIYGNVAEWVWDRHGEYRLEHETDPLGPDSGMDRVVRGGDYQTRLVNGFDSWDRSHVDPGYRYHYIGFRCARSAVERW